jgi:hypothetical protein
MGCTLDHDGLLGTRQMPRLGVLMEFGGLFKKIFGASAAIPVDERTLSGTNKDALASSLEKLADGERGWIPLAQAALLFSTEDRQYAFGELDDAGKNRLARLQRNTGVHRTSGRPKVACTSARTATRRMRNSYVNYLPP